MAVSTGTRLALAHLVGDYVLQTHHQAQRKTSAWGPATAHALTYTLAHLAVTRSPWRLAVIGGSHLVIDRFRLARWLVWLKNQAAPPDWRHWPTATGYPEDTPDWLAVWLMIAADNTLHLMINTMAVRSEF